MSTAIGFFVIGPLELLILSAVLFVVVGIPLLAVVVLLVCRPRRGRHSNDHEANDSQRLPPQED